MEPEVISSFFNIETNTLQSDVKEIPSEKVLASEDPSEEFLYLTEELNNFLKHFKLPAKVECVYNPTIYARHTYEMYVKKYCNTKKPVMYFGMNPGPWGMSQTGVPFGEISSVRDWLGIEGPVGKPAKEIPARAVTGFNCTRSEISGKRFWGLFKNICGTPENFFKSSFVYNYLPQQWMKGNGCNLTPGDFRVSFKKVANERKTTGPVRVTVTMN